MRRSCHLRRGVGQIQLSKRGGKARIGTVRTRTRRAAALMERAKRKGRNCNQGRRKEVIIKAVMKNSKPRVQLSIKWSVPSALRPRRTCKRLSSSIPWTLSAVSRARTTCKPPWSKRSSISSRKEGRGLSKQKRDNSNSKTKLFRGE